MRRLGIWLAGLVLAVAAAIAGGAILEESLRRISLDYVFVDDTSLLSSSLRLGFLVGAVLAAAAVVGHHPPARLVWLLRSLLGMVVGTALVAVLWAVLGCALAGLNYISWGEPPLPPSRRYVFCQCLPAGTATGAFLMSAVAAVRLLRRRRGHPAVLATAEPAAQ